MPRKPKHRPSRYIDTGARRGKRPKTAVTAEPKPDASRSTDLQGFKPASFWQ